MKKIIIGLLFLIIVVVLCILTFSSAPSSPTNPPTRDFLSHESISFIRDKHQKIIWEEKSLHLPNSCQVVSKKYIPQTNPEEFPFLYKIDFQCPKITGYVYCHSPNNSSSLQSNLPCNILITAKDPPKLLELLKKITKELPPQWEKMLNNLLQRIFP